MTPTVPPDAYVIEISAARRRRIPGHRVQVYALPDGKWTPDLQAWTPLLDESRLPWRTVGPWRATHEGARLLGMSEAYEIHAMDDSGSGAPLVVYLNGEIVIDEREIDERSEITP